MLSIPCPWCGPRPESEFHHGGQANIARPTHPADTSDEDWAAYLYFRTNPKGTHTERWRHQHGCGRFFNCRRDTVTDRISGTHAPGEAAV